MMLRAASEFTKWHVPIVISRSLGMSGSTGMFAPYPIHPLISVTYHNIKG